MWTKRYIFNPTKEEYFKTKHPIATSSILAPLIVYYLIVTFADADNNWWLLVGFVGCLILGVGLAYAFAVKVKIYQKVLLPILCLAFGMALIIVSMFILF